MEKPRVKSVAVGKTLQEANLKINRQEPKNKKETYSL
jgi:hypothetical protein